MPSPILDLLPKTNYSFWDSKTQHLWADHYTLLRHGFEVRQVLLSKHQCGKFEGDYYGLLGDIGVPASFHPFVTAFNGLAHPCQYKSTTETVLLPDFGELDIISKINKTKNI